MRATVHPLPEQAPDRTRRLQISQSHGGTARLPAVDVSGHAVGLLDLVQTCFYKSQESFGCWLLLDITPAHRGALLVLVGAGDEGLHWQHVQPEPPVLEIFS